MLKPIDPATVVEFIHPSDTVEPRSVWRLRPLTKRARAHILNEAAYGATNTTGGVEIRARQGSVNFAYVKAGLEGVSNFGTWADEPAPEWVGGKGRSVPTDRFLDTIPDAIFDALAEQIAALSTVSEADAGKSSPPSA